MKYKTMPVIIPTDIKNKSTLAYLI
jgi:hypothetical protein